MTTPHALSRRALLAGALSGAALAAWPVSSARANANPLVVLYNRINAYREQNGRPRLPIEHQLTAVAQAWSDSQAATGRLSHNPHATEQYGWPVDASGENVGFASGHGDDAANANVVVDAWIRSSGHRANMLGDWTDIGVGWHGAGRDLYVTANFIRTPVSGAGQEALGVSRALIGDGQASRVILVRDDLAADALSASGLVDGNTSLLLTRPSVGLPAVIREEVQRVTADGTTVYLIGGALPDSIVTDVQQMGANAVRLRGASRYETSALVADEVARVRGNPSRILLANGEGWADAVSAGPFAAHHGAPILLTPADQLHPAAADVLNRFNPADVVAVGGPSVLHESTVNRAGAWRVSGTDRADTSGRMLNDVWSREAKAGDHLMVSPGWAGDGWATGLALTPYAARHGAPLVYAGTGVPEPVQRAVNQAGFGANNPATLRFATNLDESVKSAFRGLASG